jgi:tripartite-type tricarboxylate transporter receptor subunit TctC
MRTGTYALAALFGSLAILAASVTAFAQSYPSRPIRIVVPYPPGGSTDIVSRMVAARMGAAIGQPVVVENRPGANTIIGAEAVARAEPDGYTVLFTTPATHTQLHNIVKNLPFDTVRDFTPITAAVTQSSVLVVHPSVDARTLKAFIDHARRNPGKLAYGTAGFASNFHLAGEQIKHVAGIDMVHVPYKGGAPVQQAVVAGEVPVAILSNTSATAGLKGGKIRALAVLDPTGRLKDWPDVPNIHELLPEFDKPGEWLGFYGPARLPGPIVNRLRSEIIKTLSPPEMAAKLDAIGMTLLGNTPEEFVKLIEKDRALTTKIAQRLGIQAK